MQLRRPTDRLADCVWFPRLVDKAKHHLAGSLAPEFVRPFCHPLATDGVFLDHFGIEKNEFLGAVADSNGSDEFVEEWFRRLAQHTPEKVNAWNEMAPNIGKEGFPVRRGFLWVLKEYYGGAAPDPRVDSAFTAIAYDEGFIDDLPRCES